MIGGVEMMPNKIVFIPLHLTPVGMPQRGFEGGPGSGAALARRTGGIAAGLCKCLPRTTDVHQTVKPGEIMVFARNIGKIVRPALLARCRAMPVSVGSASNSATAAMTTTTTAKPIVSFSTQLQPRHAYSTAAGALASDDAGSKTSGAGIFGEGAGEGRGPFHPTIATEQLIESFNALLAESPPQSNLEPYTAIFKALADNREGERCLELLKKLRDAGVRPTDEIYSHALRAGRRALRAREMRELFGTPIVKDQDVVTEEPSAAYQSAKEMLVMMREDECRLTPEFYDDLAFGLSGASQGGLLINIASALEARGIQPSTRFYNRMLFCLPKCGLSERADVLFSRMVFNNLADQDSYIYRISGLVNARRLTEAEAVFRDMGKLYGMHDVACNIMIKGYLDAGNIQEAYRTFVTMQEAADAKLHPNSITANTFIGYFYATGDVSTAQSVLGYFFSKGFPQTVTDYSNLLKLYARIDPIQASELIKTVLKKGLKLDADFYNAMMQVVMDRKLDRTTRTSLFALMVPEPIAAQMNSLTELCVGTTAEFRQLLARMEHDGVAPNGTTYDLCMRALRRGMNWAAIGNLYHRLAQSSVPIQNSHRNMYLDALLQVSGPQDEVLQSFIQELVTRRHPIYDYNVRGAEKLGIRLPSIVPGRPAAAKNSSSSAGRTAAAPRIPFGGSEASGGRRSRSFLEANLEHPEL